MEKVAGVFSHLLSHALLSQTGEQVDGQETIGGFT